MSSDAEFLLLFESGEDRLDIAGPLAVWLDDHSSWRSIEPLTGNQWAHGLSGMAGHLDPSALLAFLRTLDWHDPDRVWLLWVHENDAVYRLWHMLGSAGAEALVSGLEAENERLRADVLRLSVPRQRTEIIVYDSDDPDVYVVDVLEHYRQSERPHPTHWLTRRPQAAPLRSLSKERHA
jgi:hypothetical protein